MKKAVIFDFDGTIVNTITDVIKCFNYSLSAFGFPKVSEEYFKKYVGGDLDCIVTNLLPKDKQTAENIAGVKKCYLNTYLNDIKENTVPYPGITELLLELKTLGYSLAINSNKKQVLLDNMVEKLFPKDFFSLIIGFDESRPAKPSPVGIDLICESCDCTKEDVIYIGDGRSDLLTAKNANVLFVVVKWGQGSDELYNNNYVYAAVSNTNELKQAIFDWAEYKS